MDVPLVLGSGSLQVDVPLVLGSGSLFLDKNEFDKFFNLTDEYDATTYQW